MLDVPYRSQANEQVDDGFRVVEAEPAAFVGDDRCRACGNGGAKPAWPLIGAEYRANSQSAKRDPTRIALCAACVAIQDNAHRRERWYWALATSGFFVGGVWWTVAGVVGAHLDWQRTHIGMIVLTSLWQVGVFFVLRAHVRRQLMPAIVIGGRGSRMIVQLAGPAARRSPPARFARYELATPSLSAGVWLGIHLGMITLFSFAYR